MELLSESFRALGDSTRLRILRLLAQAPLNVSELVSLIGVAQSSVSHHLSKLRQLELIREERQSGFTFYSLALEEDDPRWPLIELAQTAEDSAGDGARLEDLLRQREDRLALNERLLEPGQSWLLWANALAFLLPKLDVADFGCGTGVLSIELARWAKRVTAIDSNGQALAQAKERAHREELSNIEFLKGNLEKLSLPSGKKDLVVISQTLHHVVKPDAVLGEASRLLRREGRLIVLELLPHREEWVKNRLGHRHMGFSPEFLQKEAKEAGFGNLAVKTHARDASSPFRLFLLTGVKE
jgi:ArsR family transcriptional regulator